ncbi:MULTISPECIES: hypothetical protein [unclassified Streptomyces]|uniref:hypothetical protein n=1 Tax=Streptomyces sp. NPDC058812 TaxID=3346639 RepID=UPI0036B47D2A
MTRVLEWDDPDYWTVRHVAGHYQVAEGTVTREWVHWPEWPTALEGAGKRTATRGRPMKVYLRSEVEAAVEAHQKSNPEFGPPATPEREWPRKDRVSLAEIARRLDRDYVEVRNYPRLYPPASNNPFPTAGADRKRSWGEVIDWHGARRGMGNRRTPAEPAPQTRDDV